MIIAVPPNSLLVKNKKTAFLPGARRLFRGTTQIYILINLTAMPAQLTVNFSLQLQSEFQYTIIRRFSATPALFWTFFIHTFLFQRF
jgi:hypothetical protein